MDITDLSTILVYLVEIWVFSYFVIYLLNFCPQNSFLLSFDAVTQWDTIGLVLKKAPVTKRRRSIPSTDAARPRWVTPALCALYRSCTLFLSQWGWFSGHVTEGRHQSTVQMFISSWGLVDESHSVHFENVIGKCFEEHFLLASLAKAACHSLSR